MLVMKISNVHNMNREIEEAEKIYENRRNAFSN